MRALLLIPAIVAILALPRPGAADACADAATQTDMNACYGAAYEKADAALNATYREITRRLSDDADTKALLVATERAWVAFRDAECAFSASGVAGGSIYPTVMAICLADLTSAREKQLAAYLDCAEGDLDCPVPSGQ